MSQQPSNVIPGISPDATQQAVIRWLQPHGCEAIDLATQQVIDTDESLYHLTNRLRDRGYSWIVPRE